jgi:hypothetical protein
MQSCNVRIDKRLALIVHDYGAAHSAPFQLFRGSQ